MGTDDSSRRAWRRGPLPGALSRAREATGQTTGSGSQPVPSRREPDQATAPGTGEAEEPGASARQGGCLCGAVRYEVTGAPEVVGLCHCADCRKATGGTALHYADWPLAAFAVTGPLATYAGRSFCATCGGRIAHLSNDRAEVNLGSLDDPPNDLVPVREGWTIRREPWMAAVPGAAQFERDPV